MKCQKFPKNAFFAGFQLTVFENKRTSMKKAVLQTTTLMNVKLNTVYAIYLVLTKEMAQNDICGRSY